MEGEEQESGITGGGGIAGEERGWGQEEDEGAARLGGGDEVGLRFELG